VKLSYETLNLIFRSLRNEQQPAIDTVYRSRARNISPQEIAGIHSVLKVIRTVATHDEVARIALCEQPNYAPIPVMLGLVSCSIIVQLKANLISTLAALEFVGNISDYKYSSNNK
jgi:nuclear pore complex protein Nup205